MHKPTPWSIEVQTPSTNYLGLIVYFFSPLAPFPPVITFNESKTEENTTVFMKHKHTGLNPRMTEEVGSEFDSISPVEDRASFARQGSTPMEMAPASTSVARPSDGVVDSGCGEFLWHTWWSKREQKRFRD